MSFSYLGYLKVFGMSILIVILILAFFFFISIWLSILFDIDPPELLKKAGYFFKRIYKKIKRFYEFFEFFYKRIILRFKINKIIAEINSKPEFKRCFDNVRSDVWSWNCKQIKNYSLNGNR